MKQVLQNFKSCELEIADIPAPALKSGVVLVRKVALLSVLGQNAC